MDQNNIIRIIRVKHRRLYLHREKENQNQQDHIKRKKKFTMDYKEII